MKRFKADLHIHTALSPCCSAEMSPPAVVRAAALRGLHMIAICDHNTAGNVAAAQEAAGEDIVVIAGMETTTAEDVHVVGLFPDVKSAEAAGDEVKATLPDAGEAQRKLGDQFLMDASGAVVGREAKMLAASSTFDLSSVVDLIKRHRGLAVAAHVDRPSFSVMSQLGIFPTDVPFDAIEISAAGAASPKAKEFASIGLPILTSSDSHFLSDVATCWTEFEMEAPTFCELILALKGVDGRNCRHA